MYGLEFYCRVCGGIDRAHNMRDPREVIVLYERFATATYTEDLGLAVWDDEEFRYVRDQAMADYERDPSDNMEGASDGMVKRRREPE